MTAPKLIERPNGKPYRARKVVAYVVGDDPEGVLVLGTHDVDRAQVLADQMAAYVAGADFVAASPETGWWRDGMEMGERQWVTDEVRGRAGVLFREIVEATVNA